MGYLRKNKKSENLMISLTKYLERQYRTLIYPLINISQTKLIFSRIYLSS